VQDRRMVRIHPVDEPYIEGRFRSVHKSAMLIRAGSASDRFGMGGLAGRWGAASARAPFRYGTIRHHKTNPMKVLLTGCLRSTDNRNAPGNRC
jgi:hypothetical protein